MCAKVDLRRMREASWGRTKPLRAYSMVAHGVCCGLPQASTSAPLLETILLWLMIGSQPLYSAFSAVPLFHTLFDRVVEPHCWKGDWVILLPLKNTSFPLPFVAVFPSKKQKVMNLISFIHGNVTFVKIPAQPRVVEFINLLFINWHSTIEN